MNDSILISLSVALGCGLLIGIDRERRKGSGPNRTYAGVRSFALASFTGALAQMLHPALVAVAALLIFALTIIHYWRERADDPGITTELALFTTFLLGVNAMENPAVSAAAAVVVAGLLTFRSPLHHFFKESLTELELRDALLLAGAALIVLPLMPNTPVTWLAGANPRRLWSLVILIMALQAGGYVALRLAGARLGLALSGLASGFVSSTATTAALGARCRQQAELLNACVTGTLLSNIATFLLLFIVSATIYPAALATLAPSLLSGLAAAVTVSVISLFAHQTSAEYAKPKGHAFSLTQALLFALILTGVTAAVAYTNTHLGLAAVTVGAAVAGFVDVHAAAGSVLSLGAGGMLKMPELLLAILIAFSTNTFSKIAAAYLAGGTQFAARTGLGLILIMLATWLPYFFT
ncbi:MAG: MgtC/SapB family protein [Glaciimonas sp.]|nr:MgtC/SapB family protein [Glaciimonas sp.]